MRPRSTTIEAMSMDEFLEKCQQNLDSKSMKDIINAQLSSTNRSSKMKFVMRKSKKNISLLCVIPEEESSHETDTEQQADLDSFNEVQMGRSSIHKHPKKVSNPRELGRLFKKASNC
jgi:hypothetical protein